MHFKNIVLLECILFFLLIKTANEILMIDFDLYATCLC